MRSREDEAPRLPAVPDSDTDSIADADREPVPHTYGKSDADTDPQPVTIALTYGEPNSDRGRITVTYSEPDAYGLPDTITVTDTHGKSRTYTHGPTLIQWWQRLGIATRRQL